MIKTQKWIVVDVDYPKHLFEEQVIIHDACGYFTGIPPVLQHLAIKESWALPHVYIETLESEDLE